MPKLPSAPAAPWPVIERPDVLLERATKAELAGDREAAIRLYQRVLEFDPTMLAAMNRLGVAIGERGNLGAAIRLFRNSLRIDPNQSDIWFNLGVAQSRLGQTLEALASFDCVVGLAPRYGDGHLQRAATLTRLGRYQDSLAAFDEAVRLLPQDASVAGQRGWTLQWCGDYEQAFIEFDRATSLNSDFAEARVSKGMLLLLLGDLPNGFALYEWRWRMGRRFTMPETAESRHSRPLWLGESSLAGKTILLQAEQGLGDTIQFCRYAQIAANEGASVIVEVQPALTELMRTLPGISQVISNEDPLPDHDFRCPMMSLPLAFRTTLDTIPTNVPYLRADPVSAAEWRNRMSGLRGRRIGLVWGAGARAGDSELVALEHRKSLALRALSPLANVAGCEFVSVQLGPAAKQAASCEMILHDYTSGITNFADTAGLVDNLDLMISVCTSTAHLAGAMGKPVWLLNRFDTDWRWFLDRTDSPWYPTMRIFRQPQPGDWESVIRSVTAALGDFAAT